MSIRRIMHRGRKDRVGVALLEDGCRDVNSFGGHQRDRPMSYSIPVIQSDKRTGPLNEASS